jgi:hypothetical protein
MSLPQPLTLLDEFFRLGSPPAARPRVSAQHRRRTRRAHGLARLTATGYPDLILSSEYDQWPRGRIVYKTPARRFVLYADRRRVRSASGADQPTGAEFVGANAPKCQIRRH